MAEIATTNRPLRHPTNSGTKLKWTGGVVEWVELIYAIHASGAVNGGKATLKRLFSVMGDVFEFEVDEFSRAFMDIKNRVKGDRTSFLDRLKRGLLHRMEQADRKPPKR